MKWLVALLVGILTVLQYRLWFSDASLVEMWRMQDNVQAQVEENARLAERNRILEAEVNDLKHGVAALEERARNELGMIKEGETFYQIIDEDK